MKNVQTGTTPLSVEEYIQFELQSDRRHEFINGQLIEMPGEKRINNRIALNISAYLIQQLRPKGYEVCMNDVKVASHDRTKYLYPDVFITKEPVTEQNQYIQYEPELIVEVISPFTHIADRVDKYIAYTAIPSLHYYLIVEPEITYVDLYSKNAEGRWEAATYVRKEDVIALPLLNIELLLSEVYK